MIDAYIAHVGLALPDPRRLGAFTLAIDAANGATTTVAPRLFRELGFDVEVLSASPDGRNINLDCGSTHPEALAQAVREHGCRMGVAFDGDGDRAIFVDASGRVVDGDAVLLMCARHWKAGGRLKGNAIVATVMSNIGLEIALRDSGIELVRCAVGDKYVMEEMIKRDLSIGGEQSGHIIFSDHLYTGDGIVTALSVLRVMAETGRELADLASELVTYPQVLVNVRVREKRELRSVPAIAEALDRVEGRLAGEGRLLVRYSGTEPLLRVMIEGQEPAGDSGLGGGDRRHGERAPLMSADRPCTPAQRQRQQGRHAAQLARRHASRASSRPRGSRWRPARRGSPSIRAPTSVTSGRATCTPSPPSSRRGAGMSSSTSKAIPGRSHRHGAARCGPTSARSCRSGRVRSRARPAGRPTRRADRAVGDRAATPGRGRAREPVRRSRGGADRAWRRRWAPIAWSCTRSRSRARSPRDARQASGQFARYAAAAIAAHALGLGVNAGHDLDLDNLPLFRTLPHLAEVSIGHALVSHALFVGLDRAVRDYVAAVAGA